MRKSYFLRLSLIAALCILFTSTVLAQQIISEVKVVGIRSISETSVLEKVSSRAGQVFSTAVAEEDTKKIAQLSGVEFSYYSTDIVGNKVVLTFVVVERNLVRAIVFVGNTRVKSTTLAEKLEFKLGDYLDPLQARTGAKAIAEHYEAKGYPYTKVTLDAEKLSMGRIIYRIKEGSRVRIADVKFEGNEQLKTKELQKVVKTRPRKFVVMKQYYVAETVEKDIQKMQKVYYKHGFLDIKITTKLDFNEDKSKVTITFVIVEGPSYTVGRISITGNTVFEEAELTAEMRLEQGKTYNDRKADFDVKKLLGKFRGTGYIEAKVDKKKVFVDGDKVNIEYAIVSGERFKINQINITGNKGTQDKVIRHILDEYGFTPGQWYNAEIAKGDGQGYLEKTIRNMAVTEGAAITPTGKLPGLKDAQVDITEGQTGMIMFGAGVGSDSGIVGQLVYQQRNFNIKDRPKSLKDIFTGKAFKGGGQTLRIALEPGTEVSQYSVSFSDPYFQEKPITFDTGVSSYERGREVYDEQRVKGSFSFEKRYQSGWRRSIAFRGEIVNLNDFDKPGPNQLIPGTSTPLPNGVAREIIKYKGKSSIFGLRYGFGKDKRDDRYNPSSGYSFAAGYEQVAGDYTFGVLDAVYRRYYTLHEDLAENKTILAIKLLGAAAIGDVPIFERFYAGGTGAYGIRGFEYRGISPRVAPPAFDWDDPCDANFVGTTVPGDEDPVGSDWIFIANAEVTVPLGGDTFAGILFVDSGIIEEGGYRASAGIGLQIMIPQWFGPVPMRFELAHPFMKHEDDDTQMFSFSVGRLF